MALEIQVLVYHLPFSMVLFLKGSHLIYNIFEYLIIFLTCLIFFRNTGPGLGQTQTCGGVIACNKIFVKWCLSQDRFHKHRLVLGPLYLFK
jgi:hypothetical protein